MNHIEDNARRIASEALKSFAHSSRQRILVAVAGAPGAGKSTLAEKAVALINDESTASAALFPMDGFHYDDNVLATMGRLQFKGAIDTFDAHGLRHMLQRLKANEDDVVAVPVFDRQLEISRAGGRLVPQSVDIIICEGNYLLSTQAPWDRLKPIFDFTIFVEVDEEELRRRLIKRWQHYGLDDTVIRRKVDENDLPNGIALMKAISTPDLRLHNN